MFPNVISLDDPNCLSVIQFAVDVLGVRHIIVCGHYGCGGVEAALEGRKLGLAEQWLKHVGIVRDKHAKELAQIDKDKRLDRLCELNVIAQLRNAAAPASCATRGNAAKMSAFTAGSIPSLTACCRIWASPLKAPHRYECTCSRTAAEPASRCSHAAPTWAQRETFHRGRSRCCSGFSQRR